MHKEHEVCPKPEPVEPPSDRLQKEIDRDLENAKRYAAAFGQFLDRLFR
jgi:hypothetical protein